MRHHRLLSNSQARHRPGHRHRAISRLLVCGVGALLTACGAANRVAPAPSVPTPLAQAPATTTQVASTDIGTPLSTRVLAQPAASAAATPSSITNAVPPTAGAAHVAPGAPARPGGPADAPVPSPARDPFERLRRALELADTELRAVDDSSDLPDAKLHAEAVVNILVGLRGRWYGDADGDGKITDPSDQQGVLPGSGVMPPARGLSAQRPLGWGLIAYLKGDQHTRQLIQGTIMGNMERWINRPERGYDQIEQAIAGTDLDHNLVGKLDGHAMRAVAWARLILTQAASLNDAKAYASRGTANIGASLDAARAIK